MVLEKESQQKIFCLTRLLGAWSFLSWYMGHHDTSLMAQPEFLFGQCRHRATFALLVRHPQQCLRPKNVALWSIHWLRSPVANCQSSHLQPEITSSYEFARAQTRYCLLACIFLGHFLFYFHDMHARGNVIQSSSIYIYIHITMTCIPHTPGMIDGMHMIYHGSSFVNREASREKRGKAQVG